MGGKKGDALSVLNVKLSLQYIFFSLTLSSRNENGRLNLRVPQQFWALSPILNLARVRLGDLISCV
jgi:hypothetical protein